MKGKSIKKTDPVLKKNRDNGNVSCNNIIISELHP